MALPLKETPPQKTNPALCHLASRGPLKAVAKRRKPAQKLTHLLLNLREWIFFNLLKDFKTVRKPEVFGDELGH